VFGIRGWVGEGVGGWVGEGVSNADPTQDPVYCKSHKRTSHKPQYTVHHTTRVLRAPEHKAMRSS
jgi:hypothetical protein